jgi:hypothetical protein
MFQAFYLIVNYLWVNNLYLELKMYKSFWRMKFFYISKRDFKLKWFFGLVDKNQKSDLYSELKIMTPFNHKTENYFFLKMNFWNIC